MSTKYLWLFCAYVSLKYVPTGCTAVASEKDQRGRAVRELTRVLVGKVHHIYFDMYVNSVALQKVQLVVQ